MVSFRIEESVVKIFPDEAEIKNVRIAVDAFQRLYVALDKDIADKLDEEGWEIHYAGPEAYIFVKVNAKNPVELLEGPVNLVIQAYRWRVGSRNGVMAYIKSVEKADGIVPD